MRLDVYLSEKYPEVSRAQLQRLIKQGMVKVNGEAQHKTGYIVNQSDRVVLEFDFDEAQITDSLELPVLYEDGDCVVIDKPISVLTHSKGAFNPEPTVASWLSERPGFSLSNEGNVNQRSGIVHRLDRATSGVMICAKNQAALTHLQKQFQDRKAKKTYTARIAGEINPPEAIIDLPIERNPKQPQRFRVGQNGKPSQTVYRTVRVIPQNTKTDSVLELKPVTGRTHQLRVHLDYMRHPIVGDTFYDGRPAERLFLHAHKLEITLPSKDRVTFTAPIPEVFFEENLR